jgi:DNA-binding transcriptional ArsR family regulator
MAYEAILRALADPTRRAILDRLRRGPLPVGEIARPLPVTRPAVSQHLKVLLDAGLLTMERSGTRNHYALRAEGVEPLSDWLGFLVADAWAARPAADAPEAERGYASALSVRLTPAEAWHLFTEDLALWWPVARESQSAREAGALPQAVVLDARQGGLWREVTFDGREAVWGRVRGAREASKLEVEWSLADDPSRVVVAFAREAGGCRVTLTHDSDEAAPMWEHAFGERYAAAAQSSLSNF